MRFEAERSVNPGIDPSLADMTEKAIRILDNKRTGYFLLVEGELKYNISDDYLFYCISVLNKDIYIDTLCCWKES